MLLRTLSLTLYKNRVAHWQCQMAVLITIVNVIDHVIDHVVDKTWSCTSVAPKKLMWMTLRQAELLVLPALELIFRPPVSEDMLRDSYLGSHRQPHMSTPPMSVVSNSNGFWVCQTLALSRLSKMGHPSRNEQHMFRPCVPNLSLTLPLTFASTLTT